jgi:hypothetical protein
MKRDITPLSGVVSRLDDPLQGPDDFPPSVVRIQPLKADHKIRVVADYVCEDKGVVRVRRGVLAPGPDSVHPL